MQRSVPDGHVRVSVKFGSQWFATDFPVPSVGSEMDRLAAELQNDDNFDRAPSFSTAATLVIELIRSAATCRDVRTVCLASLWRVLSSQWQGEFCRCSIDVVGGKQCDGGVDHLERFRHHTGRKRANQ